MSECKCGCKHIEEKQDNRDMRIVILQRGWVMIGEYFKVSDSLHTLTNASVVRVFGTTKGIGELINGPLTNTKLDPCGFVEFHPLTVIATIKVKANKW